MTYSLYSVYDKKTSTYQGPMCYDGHGEAKRGLMSFLGRRRESLMCEFPEDYSLWCCGKFNSEICAVEGFPVEFVCEFSELVRNYDDASSRRNEDPEAGRG